MKLDNAKKVIDTHQKAVASDTQPKYASALDAVKSKDYRDRNTAIKTISKANRDAKKPAETQLLKMTSAELEHAEGRGKGGRKLPSSKRGTSDGYMRK